MTDSFYGDLRKFKLYCKVPKFWDARNLCCILPKIQTKRSNLKVLCQNDANGIANSEDRDQTAPLGAVWSLICVCTVCLDLSVQNLRVLTVSIIKYAPYLPNCRNIVNIWAALWKKHAFRIFENKGADQLCRHSTADQRLCFRNIDSTIPLPISILYSPICVWPGWKPRRQVSRNVAHMS